LTREIDHDAERGLVVLRVGDTFARATLAFWCGVDPGHLEAVWRCLESARDAGAKEVVIEAARGIDGSTRYTWTSAPPEPRRLHDLCAQSTVTSMALQDAAARIAMGKD
jgi:hypothetical protein